MDRHDEISSLVQKEIQLRRYGNMSLERNPKQKEIEDAWEDDKRTLDAMTSALNKTNDLTAKMVKFLPSSCTCLKEFYLPNVLLLFTISLWHH